MSVTAHCTHCQEQRDTFRAELKRTAAKETLKPVAAALMGGRMDADRAVAGAMGKEVEGEEDDGWEQDEELEDMVAALNLGNTTTSHSFAASAEWKEMKA